MTSAPSTSVLPEGDDTDGSGGDGRSGGVRTLGPAMHPPERLDRDARRRAAEAAARTAEARAAVAAAEAKAAIAAAARAAAAADAAAQAAEDAAARVADEFGEPPVVTPPDPLAAVATQPVPARPASAPPADGPLPEGADRAPDADPAQDDPATAALPVVAPPPPPPHAPPVPDVPVEGRAARRLAAAETTDMPAVPAAPVPAPPAVDDGGSPPPDADGPVPAVDAADGPDPAGGPEPPEAARRRRARDADPAEPSTRASRRAGATSASRSGTPRRGLRLGVLVAAVVGAAAVLGAIAFGTGVVRAPQPASVVDSTAPEQRGGTPASPAAGASAAGPDTAGPDAAAPDAAPVSNRGVAFLAQLRQAGVPTSRAGTAEVEAADRVCDQLAAGTEPATIARSLPASLTTVSTSQAAELVEVAREHYCE